MVATLTHIEIAIITFMIRTNLIIMILILFRILDEKLFDDYHLLENKIPFIVFNVFFLFLSTFFFCSFPLSLSVSPLFGEIQN